MRQIIAILSFAIWMLELPLVAKAQKVSVNYRDVAVEKVIKDLRKQTGYQFFYKKDLFSKDASVTCKYDNITLKQFMDRVFYEELGVDYEISKGTVVLKKAAESRPFFKRNVSGMVTDMNDEPVTGATVMLKGTSTGVTTDLEGQFTILAEGKEPELEFSSLGMRTKTVKVRRGDKSFVIVQLDYDEKLLNDVLVTGYQNIKRENATGAYQKVTAKQLDERYTTDVVSRLEGQIPGLTIYSNGNNGEGENAMSIRGVSSFQARTSPLVVVDGLPIEGSIETVNPYNIESITVLKDASAASIYGARASNGVIVITTKRAKTEAVDIDFNADLTISNKLSYSNRGWANASELLQLEEYNFNYVASNPTLYNNLVSTYQANTRSLSIASRFMLQHKMGQVSDADYEKQMSQWRSNDYRKEYADAMWRNQIQHQYNLAIRTKGKKLNSSIVLNYKGDNLGVVKESDNTFQASYLGDLNVAKWLDLSFGVNLISERAKTHYSEAYSSYNGINSFAPYLSMYNADGSLADMEADIYLGEPALSDTSLDLKPAAYNLMNELNRNFTKMRRNNIRSFVHANFKILPELSVSTKLQYEDIIYKGETYLESDSYYMRTLYNLGTSGGTHYIPDGGMLKSCHENGDYITFRAQANYNKVFAEKHAVDAIAGFEYRDTHTRSSNNLLLGYDDATQTNMNNLVNFNDLQYLTSSDVGTYYSILGSAPGEDDFATTDVTHRFYSLYFTGNYTYDSRYAASFSYRVDKTDLFGADPKFRGRPLWSVGASWNMHNETFMKDIQWLDVLKLRASYGLTGNIDQSVSSYLTASIAVNDVNGQKAATLNTPPNDQLRWEKTASWNFGLDFSFLKSRLTGSLDVYSKTSSDLLALTDVDPTTGWSSLTINNGKARNTGVELQLNATILEAKTSDGLGINAGFNIACNNNKVLRIDHKPSSGSEALRTMHEGDPINSLYSYRYAGVVTSEDGAQNYSWYKKDGTVSTSSISTGEFTPEDVVFSGGLDPKVTMGFVPEITWKGFSLSAMFAYYGGHYMRARVEDWTHEGSEYGYGSLLDIEAIPSSYLNYWNAADKTTAIANGYHGATTIGSYSYIDKTVVPADFLKLRNIVLGYNFSKKICNSLGINSLRLRVQMNNVATWVRNSLGVDPEANNPVSGYSTYKTPKSYTMSLSVNF